MLESEKKNVHLRIDGLEYICFRCPLPNHHQDVSCTRTGTASLILLPLSLLTWVESCVLRGHYRSYNEQEALLLPPVC